MVCKSNQFRSIYLNMSVLRIFGILRAVFDLMHKSKLSVLSRELFENFHNKFSIVITTKILLSLQDTSEFCSVFPIKRLLSILSQWHFLYGNISISVMLNSYFKMYEYKNFVAELVFSCSVITVSVMEFWKACEIWPVFES